MSAEKISVPARQGKHRVSYFYDSDIGNYHYGQQHPMKPHRVRMAHNLIVNYGLYKQMEIFRPALMSERDLTKFHSDDYINFLRSVTPDNMTDYESQMQRFNVQDDCPVFDGLFDFCQLYASGSVGGAVRLNNHLSDVVINWSGGLHHAKKSEASGFCYVNDIVLAILELLKTHARVLYIDIDIHHGDGVEEAFYTTNRVMTASFHKYGDYFPGTGDIKDTGHGRGLGYSVNVPLRSGMDDESYRLVFKPVMEQIMEHFDPSVVVLQCGADSLTGDRLGCFNLTLNGHAECVDFMRDFGKPMLLLGGGGYTMRNVARCWAYETARVLNSDITDEMPFNDYIEYYGPDYRLHLTPSNMENLNSRSSLDNIVKTITEQMRSLDDVPGLDLSSDAKNQPPKPLGLQESSMATVTSQRAEHPASLYDGDHDVIDETTKEDEETTNKDNPPTTETPMDVDEKVQQ